MAINVLLVDDDREFLEVLSERLTIRDMNVITASSAPTALELVRTHPFDAVILDLQMPEMDGLQALEKMRATQPGLPIILLTGHATVARGVQAMKLGAVDVLEKPMDIRELVEKIKSTASNGAGPASASSRLSAVTPQPGAAANFWSRLRALFK